VFPEGNEYKFWDSLSYLSVGNMKRKPQHFCERKIFIFFSVSWGVWHQSCKCTECVFQT